MIPPELERIYARAGAVFLSLVFLFQSAYFIRATSPTLGEPENLEAGHRLLETRGSSPRPSFALSKAWGALPSHVYYARASFSPSAPLDPLIEMGRYANALWGAGIVAVVFWWAWQLWGTAAAWCVGTVAAFEPILIARGSLLTPEAVSAFLVLVSLFALWGGIRKRSAKRLGVAAISIALTATQLWPGFSSFYPLVFLAAGAAVAGFARLDFTASRIVLFGLLALAAFRSFTAFPHYLGTDDRGQGLYQLSLYLRENQIDGIYLGRTASVSPERYGIRYRPLPGAQPLTIPKTAPTETPDWLVVSAGARETWRTISPELAAWLDLQAPKATLAKTISVYDIKLSAEAHRHFAKLYEANGFSSEASEEKLVAELLSPTTPR